MASNPMHSGHSARQQIHLICVMRYTDKTIVASYSSEDISKEGVRELIASNSACVANKRYSAIGNAQAIHWMLDDQGRIYAIVTEPKYPARLVFAAIDELQVSFKSSYGFRVATASENSLTKVSKNMLQDLSVKFANPKESDVLTKVQDKLEVTKTTMKENIQQMLVNDEKLAHIEESSERLKASSIEFQNSSNELRNKMWWKMWKMRLLIGGLIVIVLICIITPLAVTAKKSKK